MLFETDRQVLEMGRKRRRNPFLFASSLPLSLVAAAAAAEEEEEEKKEEEEASLCYACHSNLEINLKK